MTAAALYAALTRPVPVVALRWHELPAGWNFKFYATATADAALAEFRGKYGRMPSVIYHMPDGQYYIAHHAQPGMAQDELIGS